MMNDKFLFQLQEQPDSEFMNDLHGKLKQVDVDTFWGRDKGMDVSRGSKWPIRVVAILAIGLIASMSFSPVRAFLSGLVTDIGGQLFEIVEGYPGGNSAVDGDVIDPQVMSLDDARSAFPYTIQMPTNMPLEYILDEDHVRVYTGEDGGPFSNTIEFDWVSNSGARLTLSITDQYQPVIEIVAQDSVEEIALDDEHTAALIRGGWDADDEAWDQDIVMRLQWTAENLTYDLTGDAGDITPEQLIEIAASTFQ